MTQPAVTTVVQSIHAAAAAAAKVNAAAKQAAADLAAQRAPATPATEGDEHPTPPQ